MKYIDCKKYADELLEELKGTYTKKFLIITVGDDPSSESYVKGKIKDCSAVGIEAERIKIDYDEDRIDEAVSKVFDVIRTSLLDDYGAVILQLPLPGKLHFLEHRFLKSLPDWKDVDGLTQDSTFRPCTPEGIMWVLRNEIGPLAGKNALVIGRSKLVGRPLFDLLNEEGVTVTLAHSQTRNLESMLKHYDIIVSAVGKPNLVDLQECRKAEIVVDVGINRVDGKLCGDCYNFDEKRLPSLKVTPVPGGVGLLTRAFLVQHVSKVCK